MSEPQLFQRTVLHLSMTHGATYGSELTDESGKVVAYMSSFVSKNEKKHPSRTVYRLGDREFVDDAEGFRQAYAEQLEQQRRDREWEAAAPADERHA